MTPEIQDWMQNVARPLIKTPGHVLEIGSLNVNGTVRQFFADADSYVGTDMQEGENVDVVVNNHELFDFFMKSDLGWEKTGCFSTIIACEVLEHDIDFSKTLWNIEQLLIGGWAQKQETGYLIITTPTFGFPLHRYPRDYWRFGEDAYREVFFEGMEILDLRHLDNAAGKGITLAGIAKAR